MHARPILQRTLVGIAAALMAAVPVGHAAAPATAPLAPGPLQGLLDLAGVTGNLGIDVAALDASMAGASSPADFVHDGMALLDRLQSAQSPADVFSAAVSAGLPAPVGQAAPATPLVPALLAFYGTLGVAPTAMQALQIQQGAGHLSANQQAGLSMLVNAANQAASAASAPSPHAAVQAAANILATIPPASGLLTPGSSTMSTCPAPPVFEDPLNLVVVHDVCNDSDSSHHALQIDLGGQDTYTNRAGSGRQPSTVNPATLHDQTSVGISIDLGSGPDAYTDSATLSQGAGGGGAIGILFDDGGDDHYTAGMTAQGAGNTGGVGILYDAGGNDVYVGQTRVQASTDLGFLLDRSGNDQYTARHGSQGSRFVSIAPLPSVLFDRAGNDIYTAVGNSQGAGNYLVDASGDDTYTATGSAPSVIDGFAQGTSIATASGMLVDGAGNDHYTSNIFGSQGYGAGQASGALVDLMGDDVYLAQRQAQGVCSTITGGLSGVLFDANGDDNYTAPSGQGASRATCVGALVDAAGDDTYTALASAQGSISSVLPDAQVQPILGALIDASGDDTYTSGAASQGSGRATSGTALLLDADGTDSYSAGADSQGSGTGSTGILVDGLQDAVGVDVHATSTANSVQVSGSLVTPGNNPPSGPGTHADQYSAGDRSQGSGSAGGRGVLIDNDDEASGNGPNAISYFAAGVTSQGASASGGVGLLVNREGRDDYSAGDGSQGSSVDGWVGALIDREGRDSYAVPNPAVSRGYGQSTTAHLSLGVLLDGDDHHDTYSGFASFSHNNMCEEKGDAGLTVDSNLPAVPPGCEAAVTAAANALAAAAGAFAANVVQQVEDLVVPPAQPAGPCTGGAGEYFCDDVESGNPGWTAGLALNQWSLVDQQQTPSALSQNAASGTHYWYVGAPGVPGATYFSAEDAFSGGATLDGPSVNLAGATAPHLTLKYVGGSEAGFDFLRVFVVDSAGAHLLATHSGQVTSYTTDNLDLTPYVGSTVTVRFSFGSDELVTDGPGWNIDDVRVAEP